jgi:methyl-accepting chemotaxis protein
MQAGTRTVEEGVETTAKAGQSLQEIIRAADHVGDMVTQIATTATEQSSTTEEINRSVDQIARLTRESAASAQQSAKACGDLSNLALDLQQLVNRFRVDSEHRTGTTTADTGMSRRPHDSAPAWPGNKRTNQPPAILGSSVSSESRRELPMP